MNARVNQSHQHAQEKEFLSFFLGEEHYALEIMLVKEIRGYEAVTKIAKAPDFIKGVINLRGDIVPIIDLRIKFALQEVTYNAFTVVIVLNIHGRVVGVVVDGVSDVISLSEDAIKPPPDFGVAFDAKYLLGLAPLEEQMVILVNIDNLISSEELGLFDKHSATTKE